MSRFTTSFLTATLVLSGAQLVRAESSAETPAQVVVNYSGVDISTTSGARVVYGRLHAAAEQVCVLLDRQADNPVMAARHRACIHTALSQAVFKLDSPLVSQLYTERTGDRSLVKMASAN
jgi:UrcA family protein